MLRKNLRPEFWFSLKFLIEDAWMNNGSRTGTQGRSFVNSLGLNLNIVGTITRKRGTSSVYSLTKNEL